MKELAVVARDDGVLAAAQPARASNDGVEDRLDVRRRARDHAEDFGRRRLLLQSFGEVGVLGLELAEQPPRAAAMRMSSPSYRNTEADQAPNSRMTLSAIASKTGWTSACAWLIARRIWAVAV